MGLSRKLELEIYLADKALSNTQELRASRCRSVASKSLRSLRLSPIGLDVGLVRTFGVS